MSVSPQGSSWSGLSGEACRHGDVLPPLRCRCCGQAGAVPGRGWLVPAMSQAQGLMESCSPHSCNTPWGGMVNPAALCCRAGAEGDTPVQERKETTGNPVHGRAGCSVPQQRFQAAQLRAAPPTTPAARPEHGRCRAWVPERRLRSRHGAVGTSLLLQLRGTAGTAEGGHTAFPLQHCPQSPCPGPCPPRTQPGRSHCAGLPKLARPARIGHRGVLPRAERGAFPAGSERSRALGGRAAGFGSLEWVVTPAEIAKMGLRVPGRRGQACCGCRRWPGRRYLRLAAGRSPGPPPQRCPVSSRERG